MRCACACAKSQPKFAVPKLPRLLRLEGRGGERCGAGAIGPMHDALLWSNVLPGQANDPIDYNGTKAENQVSMFDVTAFSKRNDNARKEAQS